MSLRFGRTTRHLLSAAALITGLAFAGTVASATPALAHGGSDSPTPYTVDLTGITLPSGSTFQDNGHVNIRTTAKKATGLHFESKCITRTDAECAGARHEAAQFIGKSFIPWSAFGVDINTECVEWVQISQYNEHFGEGGQKPVGAPCTTPTPDPEPEPEPEPKVVVPNPPQFADFCGTENDELQMPSDTDDYFYTSSVNEFGVVTVVVSPRDDTVVFLHGEDKVKVLSWSYQFSNKPCDDVVPPVDPPGDEEPPVTPPVDEEPPVNPPTDEEPPVEVPPVDDTDIPVDTVKDPPVKTTTTPVVDKKTPAKTLAVTGGGETSMLIMGALALLAVGGAACATPALVRRARNN